MTQSHRKRVPLLQPERVKCQKKRCISKALFVISASLRFPLVCSWFLPFVVDTVISCKLATNVCMCAQQGFLNLFLFPFFSFFSILPSFSWEARCHAFAFAIQGANYIISVGPLLDIACPDGVMK